MINTALTISLLFLAGFFAQWLAWRSKLPAILFLLTVGIIAGPVTHWLSPEELLGDLLFPFVSLSVAVILFEGALTLKLEEVRNLGQVVRRLVTWGALICWVITAITTHFLFGLDWGISILFGAITVVTGPTVIVPMLRTVRPTANIAKILRWEGIVIDPIGALFAVVVFDFLVSAQAGHALSHSAWTFARTLLIGISLGAAAGWTLGQLLRRRWIPDYLLNMATLAHVFLVFSCANTFAHEAGLLAVTVMGMWLANTRGLHIEEILNFKENLSVVLISGLFIILAARISPMDIARLGIPVLGLLLVMQLIARPLSVLAATVGSELNWRERALLAWIAPRGIVAAAVSALFALKLEAAQMAKADTLVPLTFSVIVGTVLLQSLTAKPLARLLKVAESSARGFLIIGANPVARKIGKVLQESGVDVLMCDTSWDNIRAARMDKLPTFYGNPVSEYADQKLDLVGLGKMLGLSPHREMNTLASLRYRSEFGAHNIYTITTDRDSSAPDKHRIGNSHQGNVLFSQYLTYSHFSALLALGAEVKRTKLSEAFTFADYQERNRGKVIPLFAVSPKGKLEIFTAEGNNKPTTGWTIIGLNYQDTSPENAMPVPVGPPKDHMP